MRDRQDPLWAVRLVKRLAKLAAALIVVATALWVAWLLLPEAEPYLRLQIETDMQVRSGDSSLGTGKLALDTGELMKLGTRVPQEASVEAIADALFPGHEFRGPIAIDAETVWREHGGLEFFTLTPNGEMLVHRVFLFKLSDEWLAVPLEFAHSDFVRTNAIDTQGSYGWSLNRSLSKQYDETRSARIIGVAGELPGPDEIAIGPITIG